MTTDGSINRKHGIIERWVGWEETGEINLASLISEELCKLFSSQV